MDRFKWLETRRGAWGAAIVLLGIGGLFSYLKPIVGIPLIIVFLIVGIVLIAQATKKAKQAMKVPETKNQGDEIDTGKQSPSAIQNFALVQLINTRVMVNHGHADWEGILTEFNDGAKSSDVLKGICTRCGKPRNIDAHRSKGR